MAGLASAVIPAVNNVPTFVVAHSLELKSVCVSLHPIQLNVCLMFMSCFRKVSGFLLNEGTK